MNDESWEVAEEVVRGAGRLLGRLIGYLIGLAACALLFMLALGHVHKGVPAVPALGYWSALWVLIGLSVLASLPYGLRLLFGVNDK